MSVIKRPAAQLMYFGTLRKRIEDVLPRLKKGVRRNKLVWHLAWIDQRIAFYKEKLGITDYEL